MSPFVLATIGNRLYAEYVSSLTSIGGGPFEYCLVDGFDPVMQLYGVVSTMLRAKAPERTAGVLFVEHDHSFTAADITTLLDFAEAHPDAVCGGIYGHRRFQDQVVGRKGQQVSTEPPAWESDLLGFGFLYTPWSLYGRLAEPWFNSVWEERAGKWVRVYPDEFLSMCCKAAGIPLYAVQLPTLTHAFEPGQRGLPKEAS